MMILCYISGNLKYVKPRRNSKTRRYAGFDILMWRAESNGVEPYPFLQDRIIVNVCLKPLRIALHIASTIVIIIENKRKTTSPN